METEMMNQRERLAKLEQDSKSVHHRLDNVEGLVESVHVIATETKAMREDVNSLTGRIEEIEQRPQRRYDTVITALITAVIGIIVGYFLQFGFVKLK